MSGEENSENGSAKATTPDKGNVLKAGNHKGETFKVVAARMTKGTYGPQARLALEGGKATFLNEKSSIVKGLNSGALKVPFSIRADTAFGREGPYVAWSLAPRTA